MHVCIVVPEMWVHSWNQASLALYCYCAQLSSCTIIDTCSVTGRSSHDRYCCTSKDLSQLVNFTSQPFPLVEVPCLRSFQGSTVNMVEGVDV